MEEEIEIYKQQLIAIDSTIAASGGPSDELNELKSNLEQLIELTTQNLIEQKKKDLLSELDSQIIPAKNDDENETESNVPTKSDSGTHISNIKSSLEELMGKKVRVPFKDLGYQNGVIFSYDEDNLDDIKDVSEANLRIVFSSPITQKMVPCQYFLSGKCKFSDLKCNYSHGHLCSLKDVKDYNEPDYSLISPGCKVLAKNNSSTLGTRDYGVVEMVSNNQEAAIRFQGSANANNVSVPFENILPLGNDDATEFQCESRTNDSDEYLILTIDPTVERLGQWEQHTKGFGSKLMMKLGWMAGSGLGKAGEGRIEPVPTLIYPSGKSLDWCIERRAKDAEEVSVSASKKSNARFVKQQKREQEAKEKQESMFNIINSACGGSSRQSNFLRKESKSSSEVEKPTESDKVRAFKLGQQMEKIRSDISRLEESLKRHKDKVTQESLSSRIRAKNEHLKKLEQEKNKVDQNSDRKSARQKLSIF